VNKQTKFDLIHYTNLASVGYYRPKNIPAIARLSGSSAISFKFGGYGETLKSIIRIEKLEYKTLKKMDDIFGPCRAISDIIEKNIGRKIKLIESIYIDEVKEYDTSVFNEFLPQKKYLLFFGTLSQVKGIGTIAEIIYPFLEKHRDYHFVFIGKLSHSQQENVTMLDILKEKAGIYMDRIIHINQISHDKLFPILNNAEFVVLPSRIDNFPNTCVEAMAHKKIVIGTIGNGFEQLINDKKNGYLIQVDRSDQLLHTIEEIIQLNPGVKKEMEEKAAERIEKLRPEYIIPQLIDFYQSAIKKHNGN
jgi:glycosyltransferase involved in cell wall biosynthesis